jgi:transcriptional regulator with PAS, ATPase and Fis domain
MTFLALAANIGSMGPGVQAIIDSISDPAIVLSRDYEIVFANSAYVERYGMAPGPPPGRLCYEVSHGNSVPCDQAGEHCPLRECLATGETARVLHVHHTRDGQEYVNVETWPVRGERGDIEYFVEVLRPSDIAQAGTGAGLIGRSQAFQRMLGLVDRVAPKDTAVLLLGESGTGKEIVARTIHERSTRSAGPFVPVECTGLPESLFESELFGHEKGAFTGAVNARPGLVESADGGTLFLDEVGEIPLGDQVKLLRLLETRCFRRVGSTQPRSADFRLVCATNRHLAELVRDGAFREDLYYRLSVFEITLPALRDRAGDVRLIAESLLAALAPGVELSAAAAAQLEQYRFPGNIRELRNILERAAIMCDGEAILPRHLPERTIPGLSQTDVVFSQTDAELSQISQPPLQRLADVEADYLRQALRRHSGDRRSLADKLGISERALYRKLSRLRRAD